MTSVSNSQFMVQFLNKRIIFDNKSWNAEYLGCGWGKFSVPLLV
jgi:hypothetical protein